jgi:hypothetical protein
MLKDDSQVCSANIHIYYHESCWHNLICFLAPILRENVFHDNILKFYLYLSNKKGAHVRIQVYYQHKNEHIIHQFIQTFEDYMLVNPSKNTIVSLPPRGFFKDFDNNSTWGEFLGKDDLGKNGISLQISNCIIDTLAKNPIDFESIYSLIIYLQVMLIKVLNPELSDTLKSMYLIQDFLKKKRLSDEIASLENCSSYPLELLNLLGENESDLLTIVNDIFCNESDPDIYWLKGFESIFEEIATENNLEDAYISILETSSYHLGIQDKYMLTFLTDLIVKVFELKESKNNDICN